MAEYRALRDRPALDVEILRRNAAVARKPVLVAVYDLDSSVHVGGDQLDERDLVPDGNCIGHRKAARTVRSGSHSVHSSPALLDPNKVVAEVVHLLLDLRLAGLADRHDADHRADPDGDPEHGKRAAHLVTDEREKRGAEE